MTEIHLKRINGCWHEVSKDYTCPTPWPAIVEAKEVREIVQRLNPDCDVIAC